MNIKGNRKISQMLSVSLIWLLLLPTQALADVQHAGSDTAILNAIAESHAAPVGLETFEGQAALQDPIEQSSLPNAMQELIEGQEQVIAGETDPTKPASFLFDPLLDNGMVDKTKSEGKNLALTAIFIAKDRKIVVINGLVLKEGEAIAGKMIKEITRNTVRLIENKRILELKLPNFSIKREAS